MQGMTRLEGCMALVAVYIRREGVAYHALDDPLWVFGLRSGANTVVNGESTPTGRATANEDFQWVCVRSVLGKWDGGTFEWVCSASED